MNKPKFSVIVPVYNVELYLSECIESILTQTYKDFEVILIDDGSTDTSGKICDQYSLQDPRIEVIHQRNGGLSAARNSGIEKATGEYILFVDSDDLIKSDTLELLYQKATTSPDIIVFRMEYFYTDGTKHNSSEIPNFEDVQKYLQHVACNKAFEQCVACNKAYKRAMFQNETYRFIKGILHEDGPFFHATISNTQSIGTINESLYRYRKGRIDSITSNVTFRNFESLMTGIDWVIRNALNQKGRIKFQKYILLHTLIFGIIQKYKSADDIRQVLKTASSYKSKLLMMEFLNSKFDIVFSSLGVLSIISPKLARWIIKFKH